MRITAVCGRGVLLYSHRKDAKLCPMVPIAMPGPSGRRPSNQDRFPFRSAITAIIAAALPAAGEDSLADSEPRVVPPYPTKIVASFENDQFPIVAIKGARPIVDRHGEQRKAPAKYKIDFIPVPEFAAGRIEIKEDRETTLWEYGVETFAVVTFSYEVFRWRVFREPATGPIQMGAPGLSCKARVGPITQRLFCGSRSLRYADFLRSRFASPLPGRSAKHPLPARW